MNRAQTLVVLADGRRVGKVVQDARGHFGFSYDENWKDFRSRSRCRCR